MGHGSGKSDQGRLSFVGCHGGPQGSVGPTGLHGALGEEGGTEGGGKPEAPRFQQRIILLIKFPRSLLSPGESTLSASYAGPFIGRTGEGIVKAMHVGCGGMRFASSGLAPAHRQAWPRGRSPLPLHRRRRVWAHRQAWPRTPLRPAASHHRRHNRRLYGSNSSSSRHNHRRSSSSSNNQWWHLRVAQMVAGLLENVGVGVCVGS